MIDDQLRFYQSLCCVVRDQKIKGIDWLRNRFSFSVDLSRNCGDKLWRMWCCLHRKIGLNGANVSCFPVLRNNLCVNGAFVITLDRGYRKILKHGWLKFIGLNHKGSCNNSTRDQMIFHWKLLKKWGKRTWQLHGGFSLANACIKHVSYDNAHEILLIFIP